MFVTETRLRLGRFSIPASMVGLGLEPASERDASTRTLVARDFSGQEIDRITLQLDTSKPAVVVGPLGGPVEIRKYPGPVVGVAGIGIGLTGALARARVLSSLPYGIIPPIRRPS